MTADTVRDKVGELLEGLSQARSDLSAARNSHMQDLLDIERELWDEVGRKCPHGAKAICAKIRALRARRAL